MEYNSKSLTRDGATLFAQADQQKQAIIFDKMIVSDKVITEGTDISALTVADFTNSKQFDVNNVTQSSSTFSATSVMANDGLTANFSISLVGLIAHLANTTEQHLVAVMIGNDPFILPPESGVPFRFVATISVGYSASQDVHMQVNDDVYITQADLAGLLSNSGFATQTYVDDAIKNNKVTLPDDLVTTEDTKNWQKYKLTSDDGKAINYTGDVNDLKTAGQYFVKNPSHVPDSGAWWFVDVKVSPDAGTIVIHQSAHGDNFDMFWERTCRNGVWSDWAKRISGVDLENRLATFAKTITDSIMAKIVDPNTGQAKIKMNFNYGDLTVDTDPVVPIVKVADEATATSREATHPNTQHEWGES
ncbi:pyocin knob domain-containing protein [Lentilactobacillus sp. SPB1-3]|uniref:Pyocin knob domain-containing protein n=1 Tax=Lentilactobacillus terminaliae TaxID=3003483 RepID=A0ACD5DDG9_9LACO|nr:pyocin knob domain-containing protein [Lentilactobacillus sp. SPB1-3]MCZ0978125.1 pyocin knob domain-containing protein [Lentilactobacillus sp. SPB1-3]